ncbi:MAG: HEAT repeat domain-containing protein, partial [Planctomycetota bacterium]
VGVRADQDREFLASRDIWFRPVQMANAPDGTLYVLDMSREVIEHPDSLPPVIKQHIDLTSGRSQGRIYRIVPNGFEQPTRRPLGELTTEELVAALDHPNGWHRETAARLIYQWQDRAAVQPLEELSARSSRPETRIRALYALAGLDAMTTPIVLARLSDEHPRVREHAVRLAERFSATAALLKDRLLQLVDDPDPRVRYQLAFSLGEFQFPEVVPALCRLLKRDVDDPWMRLATQSSLAEGAGGALAELAGDATFRGRAAGRAFLTTLAKQVGAQNRADELAPLVNALPQLTTVDPALAQQIVQSAVASAGRHGDSLRTQLQAAVGGQGDAVLRRMVDDAINAATDENRTARQRVEAIRTLSIASFSQVIDILMGLIDSRQPHQVQVAALAVLAQFDDEEVADRILQQLHQLSPRTRSAAWEAIFARRERV